MGLTVSSRDFFYSLLWDYDNPENPIPIFTNIELETLPLKWLKYLLIERVNLTTAKKLSTTIHRLDISELTKVKRDCVFR